MSTAHRPVTGLQRGRAKSLKREMTDAERRLWMALRGHRFQRLSFRRQAPIGPFIVDFVCHRRRLTIEIDGGQHATKPAHDIQRDAWLASKGYRILRFWNSDVLRNREGVLETIVNAIRGVPPSLTLPLKGGGDRFMRAVPLGVSRSIAVDKSPLPNPPPQAGEEAMTAPRNAQIPPQAGEGAAERMQRGRGQASTPGEAEG
jgi:very-short-patch-repair endonuclease